MILSIFGLIYNWLDGVMGNFRDFISSQYSNPLLWLGLFGLGLLIFFWTYGKLNKH